VEIPTSSRERSGKSRSVPAEPTAARGTGRGLAGGLAGEPGVTGEFFPGGDVGAGAVEVAEDGVCPPMLLICTIDPDRRERMCGSTARTSAAGPNT
jgi:hypothetical protein